MSNYLFQKLLILSRLFVFLPVIFGIISAMILFIASTIDMIQMIFSVLSALRKFDFSESLHLDIVSEIIGAVDLYLIAIVLLIFSFGLYELFISEETFANKKIKLPKILAIGSLDELKDKLAKVIVMVLVVSFFQRVLYIKYNGALEMMYFALSISALSVGVYLLHKDAKFKKAKKALAETSTKK
jgi:uncharacterized membrane protein YqhA